MLFEEAAIAYANLQVKVQALEQRIKDLEAELQKLKDTKGGE